MSCRQCQGIETEFNDGYVRKKRRHYRKKGPAKTTRMLLSALTAEPVAGCTLLDIGGGVGAIQHALIAAGISKAINVEASPAYAAAAREEAVQRNILDRIEFIQDDFVTVADTIPTVDIVTLDRVICCFDDMDALVGHSAGRAGKWYGVVYPRDIWWVKAGFHSINFILKLFRRQFRTFIHPTKAVEAIVQGQGLNRKIYSATAGMWQVAVFGR